jgi:hypothetical protein
MAGKFNGGRMFTACFLETEVARLDQGRVEIAA